MKSENESPWTTHHTREIYDNPWISVSESQVTNPGGGDSIYGVVHYKNRAVGIVPIDEEGHTWLVGQFRYTLGSYEWEIPAGGCPQGESPVDTARRELQEETGLLATDFEIILDNIALSNSVSDERATLFVARNLTESEASPEETEELTVKRLPLSEAIAMAQKGAITDSMSVIALLKLATDPQQSGRQNHPSFNS